MRISICVNRDVQFFAILINICYFSHASPIHFIVLAMTCTVVDLSITKYIALNASNNACIEWYKQLHILVPAKPVP